MAHQAGLEPAVARLTAGCFTIKLLMNKLTRLVLAIQFNVVNLQATHSYPIEFVKFSLAVTSLSNGSGCGKCAQRGSLREVMGLLTLTSSLTRNQNIFVIPNENFAT